MLLQSEIDENALSAQSELAAYNTKYWHASLRLEFQRRLKHTRLTVNRHHGPLRVQRPFYPDKTGICHCYILHPPGGVVGGDRLSITIEADKDSQVLLTTPGAGKFYRSPELSGEIVNQISIASGAHIDWLPQETIYFNGSDAKVSTRIDADKDARYIFSDIACLGRPTADDYFTSGRLDQRVEIRHQQKIVLIDRNRFNAQDRSIHGKWGWQAYTVNGLLLANETTVLSEDALQLLARNEGDCLVAVTRMNDLAVVRYLGHSAEQAKSVFVKYIKLIKQERDHQEFVIPRIWHT